MYFGRATYFIGFIFGLSVCLSAQENEIKKVFTTIQQAINTELLTKSGSKIIGGSLFFQDSKDEFEDQSSLSEQRFQVTPAFSYFFIDNLALGLELNYSRRDSKREELSGTEERTINQVGIGPVITKYFMKGRMRPFVDVSYVYLSGDNTDGSQIDMGGGFIYHLANNIAIGPFVTYSFIFNSDEAINSSRLLQIGVGITNFIF